MWKVLKWIAYLALAIVAAGAGIYFTGNTLNVIVWLSGPPKNWDLARKAPDPDYAQASSWAAWPGREGPAGYVPTGVSKVEGAKAVDVFFIHPTGYMNGADWNSPLNPQSRTEENTTWMMANQASAYNGSANVYAPRYREASIFRYMGAPEDLATKAMDFAYADVVRAFEYYMANENKGKPFIIASHSQGSQHAFRLLQEKIDGTNLQSSMVAAYVIGTRITNPEAASLKSIKVCDTADQTGCLVHWAAMGDGGTPPPDMSDLVCVNPLSWKRDGGRAPATMHKGGVPISGTFSVRMFGDDSPQGIEFKSLEAPQPGLTWAECRNGFLYVADQSGGVFNRFILPGKNYHGLDYPLFHMDIRMNVAERVSAYLKRGVTDGPAPAPQE
jgi:hypothetical protein